MLIRNDQIRKLDRLSQQWLGTMARPATMPMDAWRDHDEFVIELDIPGVDPDSIDIDVERHVVTVRAERPQPADHQNDMIMSERARGVFSRQLVLGESLDTDQIRAGYDAGVLVLRIPIAERAKPRKVEIATGTSGRLIEAHSSGESSTTAADTSSGS